MKKFWAKVLPSDEILQNSRLKKIVGSALFRPELWQIRRESIATGAAIGLFWAFIPVPAQMLLSSITAIVFRANIPVGLAMCWITNPLTIPFFLLMNYRVGLLVTASQPVDIHFHSLESMKHALAIIWLPLGLGSLTVAVCASAFGYFFTLLLWRTLVLRKHTKRGKSRKKYKQNKT